MEKKRRGWIIVFFAIGLFVLDAVIKYWTQSHLVNMQYASPFYPYGGVGVFKNVMGIDFSLSFAKNTGAAWSVFSKHPILLLFIRIGMILSLMVYVFFLNKIHKRTVPLILILVGAVANVLDYFIYGAVIDMFYFILWGYPFPVFNVADMLIFFGIVTLVIQSLQEKFKRKIRYAS